MPRRCSICTHKKRSQIEAAMLGPASIRAIAAQFQLSHAAVQRHKTRCLPTTQIAKQAEQEQQRRGQSLADLWIDMKLQLQRLADDAKQDKDRRSELGAVRELIRLTDLGLRAAAELKKNESANVPLHEHRDFVVLTSALVTTLAPYPEAQDAVCSALDAIAAQGGV